MKGKILEKQSKEKLTENQEDVGLNVGLNVGLKLSGTAQTVLIVN